MTSRVRAVLVLAMLAVSASSLVVSGPTAADSGETPWYFATRPAQQSISTSYGDCIRLSDGTVDCQIIDLAAVWMGRPELQVTNDLSSIDDATSVSVGTTRACALHATGAVSCWGSGSLGDGGSTGSSVPVAVTGITNAIAVSSGPLHSCALLADFTVSCWGVNNLGQVGDGTAQAQLVPVAVSGLTDVVAIDAGSEMTCALLIDGTVSCWGVNLGSPLSAPNLVPTAVDGIANAIAISVGVRTACVLLSDLTVSCWGYDFQGDYDASVSKVDGIANAVTVTVGQGHACALLLDFTITCWGENRNGELGVSEPLVSTAPVTAAGITNAVAVSAGTARTCAVLADATYTCWGWQPSVGSLIAPEPAPVIDVVGASAVAVGGSHSCAVVVDDGVGGAVACWGANNAGQLGDGTTTNSPTPVVVPGIAGATLVAAGDTHSCAAMTTGVKCWGSNDVGQLGDGSTSDSAEPVSVTVADGQTADLATVVALAAGANHTCALLSAGTVVCWGENADGQLGDRGTDDSTAATLVQQRQYGTTYGNLIVGANSESRLALGDVFSCVLGSSILTCWGDNEFGQLGDGTNTGRAYADGDYRSGMPAGLSPVPPIIEIAAARDHMCANLDVNADQSTYAIYCWGANTSGALGVASTTTSSNLPLAVTDATGTVDETTLVSAGAGHACASHASTVTCWGDDPTARSSAARSRVFPLAPAPADTVIALGGHANHTCAVLADGSVECWGETLAGQTGTGVFSGGPTPVAVAGFDASNLVLPTQEDLGSTTTSTVAEETTSTTETTESEATTTTGEDTTSTTSAQETSTTTADASTTTAMSTTTSDVVTTSVAPTTTVGALPSTGGNDRPFAWALLLGALGALAAVSVRRSPRRRVPG